MNPRLSVDCLLDRLQEETATVGASGAGLAFDGDGTLWSGDVGDDVFFHAIDRGLLREEARPALRRVALEHNLDDGGSASALARRIYEAHLDSIVSQPVTYAMMAWCFAGHTLAALRAIAREALAAAAIDRRLHQELSPILAWAREAGLRTIVISASPHPVVEVAAARWHVAPIDIAAVRPSTDSQGYIEPRLHGEVPYGKQKTQLGRKLLGDARWVAAFGDNSFDAAMLTAAEIGVAVRPKPALRELLPQLEGVVELV